MLYNFESETELEIARNWCAGAFGWSRKRLLGEAMAAPFSCRETCFVFASANAWKVSRRRGPILKRSLASTYWTGSDLLWKVDIFEIIWCALSTQNPEETHINYIIEGNSTPIIPLLLADVVCEPVRRQKTEGYLQQPSVVLEKSRAASQSRTL